MTSLTPQASLAGLIHPAGSSGPLMSERACSTTATQMAQNGVFERCARGGYVPSGLLHLTIGYLAIRIALGSRGETPDQSGPLAALAAKPGGVVALWVAEPRSRATCFGHPRRPS